MSNRRIALGLGTGAGALLGAALLSGLTSPIAAADTTTDVFAIDPVSSTLVTDTLPAFGGLGTDTITTEEFANTDTSTTPASLANNVETDSAATGGAGSEDVVTNTYSNPLFTDTSAEVTEVCGTGGVCETLAQADATGGATPTDLDGSLF